MRKPDYTYRKEYVEEEWTDTVAAEKKLIDWMGKVGMNSIVRPLNQEGQNRVVWDNVGENPIPELQRRRMLIEVGGHGYQNFLPTAKYFDKHPNWFGPWDGIRSEDANIVFKTANKASTDQFTDNILSYLKARPEIDILDLRPPYGAHWSNNSANTALGGPFDRQTILLNEVAPANGKLFPKLKIEFIVYSEHQSPPPHAGIAMRNLLMDFCPGSRSFEGEVAWYSYYTKYIMRSLRIVMLRLIQQGMDYLHSLGVVGIGCFTDPGNWFTYEFNPYVIVKTACNSDVNVNSLIADDTKTEFGAAAKRIEEYFRPIETTVPRAIRIQGGPPANSKQVEKYLRGFQDCSSILRQGLYAADGDKRDVFLMHKLELSLTYATLDYKIRGGEISLANEDLDNPGADIKRSVTLYEGMVNLFDNNLARGIFIRHGGYHPKFQKLFNAQLLNLRGISNLRRWYVL